MATWQLCLSALIDPVVAAATIGVHSESGYLFSAEIFRASAFGIDAKSEPSTHTSVSIISGTGSPHFFVSEVASFSTIRPAPSYLHSHHCTHSYRTVLN